MTEINFLRVPVCSLSITADNNQQTLAVKYMYQLTHSV